MTTYNQTRKREARANIRRTAGVLDYAIQRHDAKRQLELAESILVESAKLVNALRAELGQSPLSLVKS
jgi:hypothetical protein